MELYRYIAADDNAFTYYGRWELKNGAALANWNSPYVAFSFTGTSLKGVFENGAVLEANIDGVIREYSDVSGELCLCEGLKEAEHTAVLTITNADGRVGFGGAVIDADAEVIKYKQDKKYIQFIGDSITTSRYSYSYTIPREHGYDYSIISMNGISLMDGSGWYFGAEAAVWTGRLAREDSVGIESAYFCVKSPKDAYSLKNDELIYHNPVFDAKADHKPDVVVIGIGTNDNEYVNKNVKGLTKEDFKQSYAAFIGKLITLYPDAHICVLRPFNNSSGDFSRLREATKSACETVGSENVHYIDTSEWQVEISGDNTHPTENGYASLKDLVYDTIWNYLFFG